MLLFLGLLLCLEVVRAMDKDIRDQLRERIDALRSYGEPVNELRCQLERSENISDIVDKVDRSAARALDHFLEETKPHWDLGLGDASLMRILKHREMGGQYQMRRATTALFRESLLNPKNPWTVNNMLMSRHFSIFALPNSFDEWFTDLTLTRLVREVVETREWKEWDVLPNDTLEKQIKKKLSLEGSHDYNSGIYGAVRWDECRLRTLIKKSIVINNPRLREMLESEYTSLAWLVFHGRIKVFAVPGGHLPYYFDLEILSRLKPRFGNLTMYLSFYEYIDKYRSTWITCSRCCVSIA
jgi:hypothetical protein